RIPAPGNRSRGDRFIGDASEFRQRLEDRHLNPVRKGFAPVGNGDIAFVQFSAYAGLGGSSYDVLTQPIPDPSLPINQINAAYQLGCQYATNPCGRNDQAVIDYV